VRGFFIVKNNHKNSIITESKQAITPKKFKPTKKIRKTQKGFP